MRWRRRVLDLRDMAALIEHDLAASGRASLT
jgi:hypothetical protein